MCINKIRPNQRHGQNLGAGYYSPFLNYICCPLRSPPKKNSLTIQGACLWLLGMICKALKKPKEDQALDILKRVASQVEPILTNRAWKVTHLQEFFPSNPNLLGTNVNRGYKINLRLRPHYDDSIFLDYEDILGTMLHELVHIVKAPHDATFYKMLEELNQELDELIRTGYTGQGFYSMGHRVGTGQNPLSHQVKCRAATAAERRRGLQGIMLPVGGICLGGIQHQDVSPSIMAANAAEKRKHAQVGASHRKQLQDHPAKKRVVIDLTVEWSCPTCTFQNHEKFFACEMCLSIRPPGRVAPDESSTAIVALSRN
ncbi:WLM domain-containing protein [Phycomyces nitens]|nr:WLM domain-containing protein [Phycomyces nitens]